MIQDVDINLQLAPPDQPGQSRPPDLIVVDRVAVDRVDAEGGYTAPRCTWRSVIKRGEYADAGIPHYWVVDLNQPVTLVACLLAGAFGHQDTGSDKA